MLARVPFPIRLALRSLRRRPAFSLLAIGILALGIGANGTVFSVLDAVILRSLPFEEPDQLVQVSLTVPAGPQEPAIDDMVFSYPKYQTFLEEQRSFSSAATYRDGAATLLTDAAPLRLTLEEVSGDYFRLLGVPTALGRAFVAEEDQGPDAPGAVVLGDQLWRSQFGGDAGVIGRQVVLSGRPATIVGVAPPGFRGLTGQADLWVNIASAGSLELSQRWSHSHAVVARLAEAVPFAAAAADVERLGGVIDAAHPAPRADAPRWGATLQPLAALRADPALARTVVVLGAAVGLVLLVACVNLAGLLLARAHGRQRELAVQLAIGARRGHIVQTLLAESVLLAVAGGALGLLLTWLGVSGLASLWAGMGASLAPRFGGLTAMSLGGIGVSGGVVLFLAGISVVAAVLVGLLPALRATNPDLVHALHGSTARAGRHRLGLRDTLVAAQVALAVTLLVGAGLMIRSMANLLATDTGVVAEGVVSARLAMPPDAFVADSAVGFYDALLARAQALPGVSAAALGNCPPLNGGCNRTVIWFRDRPEVPEGQEPLVGVHMVSPGWFRTLGVAMRQGRDFTPADRRGAPRVAIINETAARTFYPGEDPVGRRIAVGQGGFHEGSAEIIGVVGDVRFGTLEEAPMPDVFISYLQAPRSAAIVYLRGQGDPAALAGPLRALITEMAPTLPVFDIQGLPGRLAFATVRPRFATWILGGFAVAALLLAAVGVYALLAFEVTLRRREIGIRMALGSSADRVVGGVMRRGLVLAVIGVAAGVPLAMLLSRFLGSLLFEVRPGDPVTYAAISLILLLVTAVATLFPARAATRINPMEAIRTE